VASIREIEYDNTRKEHPLAHVEDRWYREVTGPDNKKVREKTERYGKGMR
jgi:hypothetical protein